MGTYGYIDAQGQRRLNPTTIKKLQEDAIKRGDTQLAQTLGNNYTQSLKDYSTATNTNPAFDPVKPYMPNTKPAATQNIPVAMSNPSPQIDIAAETKKLQDAQTATAIAGIDKQYQGYMSNLSGEKAQIQPMAYNDRNKANITMNNTQRGWSEYLAARGLQSSGVGALGTVNTMNQYQGEIGAINRDATNKEADILRRETLAGNERLADIEAARQGIAAQGIQNLINQYNADRTFNRGVLESDRGFNYQSGRDAVGDNRYANETAYNRNRDAIADNRYSNEFAYQKEQDALNNAYKDKQFNEDVRRYEAEFSENQRRWNTQYTFDQRKQSFVERQQQIDNAVRNRQLTNQEAELQLSRDRFAADQDPNSIDNQLKKQQIDLNTYTKSNAVLNDTIQRLDSLYTYKNTDGQVMRNPQYSDTQLRSAIIGLNLEDNQTDALLLRYGLPIN